MERPASRRSFLQNAALTGAAALFPAIPGLAAAAEPAHDASAAKEVTPVEDLMREHGGLNRILLIYEEALRQIRSGDKFNWREVTRAADLVRSFIEGYHEKLEEEYVFPRLQKAGRLADLVKTLKAQHDAGRKLTERILSAGGPSAGAQSAMESFIRMYRPHEAREDTVLFPEFKKLVSAKEYDELGDRFEDREHELFGKAGFDGIVVQIAEIEKSIGIYDLAKFTPAV